MSRRIGSVFEKELLECGFYLFNQVISSGEILEIREEIERIDSELPTAGLRGILSRSGRISELANSDTLLSLLPSPTLRPVRGLLFDKTPKKNWPVAWHQDRTIVVEERIDVPGYRSWTQKNDRPHVEPPPELLESMVTLRIHLDDTPAENGALRVCPGSHRNGFLSTVEIESLVREGTETVACEAGDVLAMAPLLLHSSPRSENALRRRVLHFEYAERERLSPLLQWAEG